MLREGENIPFFLKKTPRLLFISALTHYGKYSKAATVRSAAFFSRKYGKRGRAQPSFKARAIVANGSSNTGLPNAGL